MRGTRAWPPTGLIPWFSKTEGNNYATLLHHPFLFKGKPTQCSRGSKKNFWLRCRGGSRKQVNHTKYPSQSLSLALHYLPFASRFPLPHFTLAVLFALSFPISSSLSLVFCVIVAMASSLSTPLSPVFEVLHFKQRQGENLKDAWYRMMESYHKCTLEVNFRILLRNFYVGLNMTHRQLLDCIAKGNFIEIDHSIAREIIEGIVGKPPQKGGSHPTQEETQMFEKIC